MSEKDEPLGEKERVEQMPLADLLRGYRDGDEHGWPTEFQFLWDEHYQQMDSLTYSVQQEGIREPIVLGYDGRVWDGHHRLAAAYVLGIESVPVTRLPPDKRDRP